MSSAALDQRKRSNSQVDVAEDPPMPGTLSLVPYFSPSKVRAVAGPSQEQFDEQRETNKALLETLRGYQSVFQRLTSEKTSLVDQNNWVSNKINQLHQEWRDKMEVNNQLDSMHQEEVHLREAAEESLRLAQQHQKNMEQRLKEANEERERVTRDKISLDAEIIHLRTKANSQQCTTPTPPLQGPSASASPPPPRSSSSTHQEPQLPVDSAQASVSPQQQRQVPPQTSTSFPPPQQSSLSSSHQQPHASPFCSFMMPPTLQQSSSPSHPSHP
ncbi:hypothetical protein BDP27DRAFT_1426394 [Rhodocollybia butyracea]|uniref:Uncharacterized protein n=1 Tax=Rhodocollybia butyracea TaxID=206335 RepID=A0A9P5PIN5_9AGAR|nr:hypothetical protein BDP27DRAFT_1426394 [Rhodocollybia butyracea]